MVKIVHLGLGPLGQKVVQFALERSYIKIVGAVDPAADKVGRDLGEVCGREPLNIIVSPDLATALKGVKPAVALVTTVSSLKKFESQATELANAGLNVVSTCEELSFPWETQPQIARKIDEAFKENNVACVGTGVNPGYLMDFLPAVLTGICQRVDHLKVLRVQNASSRRIPFQQKIGAGLTLPQFHEKVSAGTLRHVGLTESAQMIAHHLGWKLDNVTEDLGPVIAEKDIAGGYMPITRGLASGVAQTARGFIDKREVITLQFRAAVGEPESFDRIEIKGVPDVVSTIAGGVNGDSATCAITINAIRSILKSKPGLRTMVDLYPIGYCSSV
ncbi:MAG: dihydrodipicolinate reductase [Kiritimatiellia bacterium]|nr:dihydrodipicolinate reductase [Kiritimatiellia bacterium]